MAEEFDLLDTLICDTLLTVKMTRRTGGSVFVHYVIPREKKDGTVRQYGDIYKYFTGLPDFRFAIGYLLEEQDEQTWKANKQYFYFDKRKNPYWSLNDCEKILFLPKYRNG